MEILLNQKNLIVKRSEIWLWAKKLSAGSNDDDKCKLEQDSDDDCTVVEDVPSTRMTRKRKKLMLGYEQMVVHEELLDKHDDTNTKFKIVALERDEAMRVMKAYI